MFMKRLSEPEIGEAVTVLIGKYGKPQKAEYCGKNQEGKVLLRFLNQNIWAYEPAIITFVYDEEELLQIMDEVEDEMVKEFPWVSGTLFLVGLISLFVLL